MCFAKHVRAALLYVLSCRMPYRTIVSDLVSYGCAVNVDRWSVWAGCTGSRLYMSPEVYQGLPYNEKVDVFSFAIVLYEVR